MGADKSFMPSSFEAAGHVIPVLEAKNWQKKLRI